MVKSVLQGGTARIHYNTMLQGYTELQHDWEFTDYSSANRTVAEHELLPFNEDLDYQKVSDYKSNRTLGDNSCMVRMRQMPPNDHNFVYLDVQCKFKLRTDMLKKFVPPSGIFYLKFELSLESGAIAAPEFDQHESNLIVVDVDLGKLAIKYAQTAFISRVSNSMPLTFTFAAYVTFAHLSELIANKFTVTFQRADWNSYGYYYRMLLDLSFVRLNVVVDVGWRWGIAFGEDASLSSQSTLLAALDLASSSTVQPVGPGRPQPNYPRTYPCTRTSRARSCEQLTPGEDVARAVPQRDHPEAADGWVKL